MWCRASSALLAAAFLAGRALARTDITAMLYINDAITAPAAPDSLPSALTDVFLTTSNFTSLPGKLQRALLWSAGWVRAIPESAGSGSDDTSNQYVQVYVLCGRTMSDVFQVSQAFDNTTACDLHNCKSNVIMFTDQACSPSYVAQKTLCALSPDASVTFKTKSGPMWALDGQIDDNFNPQLFQFANASKDDDTTIFMLAQKGSWGMTDETCPNAAMSIAPCTTAAASDVGTDTEQATWCKPKLDQGVVLWLQNYQAELESGDGGSSSKVSSTVAIVLGVLLAIFVVVCVVFFVLYRRAKSWSKDGLHENEQNTFFMQAQSFRPPNGRNDISGQYVSNNGPHPSYENAMQIEAVNESFRMRSPELAAFCDDQELMLKRIAFAGIVYRQKMTSGPNGEVWRGEYEGQQVAIKCTPAAAIASAAAANSSRGSTALHASALLGDKEIKALVDFTKEIRMAAFLDHPNIVHFVGLSWRTLPDLCMVSEYVALGDLAHFLAQPDSKHLTWKGDKLAIAADISNALVYLHSLSPIVLHRDLKSLNVLLTEDLTAKVSDFGLSRETSFDETMTSGVGTLLWTAPEVLRGEHYSEKADIYSFGVVLAELDTCLPPYAYSQGRKNKGKNDMDWVPLIASGRATPPFRPDCPRAIRDLAAQCLDQDPNKRPPAMQIVYMLRSKIPPTL